MREKIIEQKLVQAVKARGGIAPKFVSPSMDGMPDRLVLLPRGGIGFVEVKAPGQQPTRLQRLRLRTLQKMGFHVFVLDDPEQIDDILKKIGGKEIEIQSP